ncbi:double-strand break repair helicase AddA [Pseudohoeflea suaedae]|uniref:DNA 3'-5' helicase n=1 Tax=Pseudohoeflea suaedae TaxID=877384 RepID=A0A4R5PLU3_9HYPH|nr:double-strand break repair helicase AddA [Pseudohoeflea suaedae]TDH37849.1 double-strand break repair helicase AddA [Pseudohoeflea suaedae]
MTDDRLRVDTAHDPVSETTLRQRLAATPGLSAWVAANAGSGKTHVLANRVIRLLLAGARPSSILCLTYTKAAAAEMSNRVFRILAGWSRMPEQDLAKAIEDLGEAAPGAGTLARARQLFAMALETPGGLKIQTIHAFCEAVLQRFPLEANIAGRFQVLDDREAANLLAEARRLMFSAGVNETDDGVPAAIDAILDRAGEGGLEALLADIYSHRRAISDFLARADRRAGIEAELRDGLDIAPQATRQDALSLFWPLQALDVETLRQIESAAGGDKPAKTALAFAQDMLKAVPGTKEEASRIVSDAFLNASGEIKSLKNVGAKQVAAVIPDIAERLEEAKAQVATALEKLSAFDVLDDNLTALHLARRYIAAFERLKHRQGFLDFDDLVAATDSLLSRSGAGAWVHYKLDQGIDHILVDEAQDTAPLQWNVIRSLASEFFAGEGSRGGMRTLFSVGDEKQSIYSFQGARPESFSEERRYARRKAEASGRDFETIPLRVSFRSTREVLKLVDLVYESQDAQRGLGEERAAIIHESARRSAPGEVELWDMIAAEQVETGESWTDPFDHVPESAPAARLAARIAATIRSWIGSETIADRKGNLRPVTAGDILVLVRKRDGFVPTLLRMLKAGGNIPVAGADRLKLTDHIAVQDLIALGRHVLHAGDDLSLAGLAKSPLVQLDEDALFRLAAGRDDGMSLARRLAELAVTDPAFAEFHKSVIHWRDLAGRLSVHDFFATILGPEGGRVAYLGRLGTEVGDVLDEFLGLALDHDEAGIPGLQSFIAMLDSQSPEIKREMEQEGDAVRVMTVHASKGLEAPIVFLVDSGGADFQASHVPKFWLVEGPRGRYPLWLPDKASRSVAAAQQAVADQKSQAEEEYRRLLYVGLTRPADRLVVCGYRGLREAGTPTWHSMVESGFGLAEDDADLLVEQFERPVGEESFAVRRIRYERDQQPAAAIDTTESRDGEADRASFHCPATPLPRPAGLPRPLMPSAAGAAISGDEPRDEFISPFSADRTSNAHAAERGKAAHRLLQVLPGLPRGEREAAARRYCERAMPSMPAEDRQALVAESLAVLNHPDFSDIFDAESRTEVSVMGTIELGGRQRVVSGRIDRLSVSGDEVLILDYKTGAMLPGEIHHPAHAAQLAVYREVLKPLYPGKAIRAALLYTGLPKLVMLSAAEMDEAFATLVSDQATAG